MALKEQELLAKLAEWHTISVVDVDEVSVADSAGAGLGDPAVELLAGLQAGGLLAHTQHLAAATRELAELIEATTRKARAVNVHALSWSMPSRAGLEARFAELVIQWKDETEFEPSLARSFMNRAYQQIIGLGAPAVPLILEELRREPDHWFWALTAITGEDPAGDAETVEDGAVRWLEWGQTRGLIA